MTGEHRHGLGPVGSPAHAVVRPLPGSALSAHGLLGSWQRRNRHATIDHCVAQLQAAGNLDNFRRLAGESAAAYRGFHFADSDVYKVLEALAWETGRAGDAGWSAFIADTVALLEAAQDADGYLDSFIQGLHPGERWIDLDEGHELYCAGHLIQAAVALDRAIGDATLLVIARRCADLIVEVFTAREGVDGHPLIETALVELYRHTGDERYLEMASRMVELRGRGVLHGQRFGPQWLQDHVPVREATEAIGHAVRQLCLAAGVTDVYLETGDASLLEAMERLWHSAFTQKVFVTGGHGSRHRDESYGDPYELPPDRAYAETCAAIAAFMWNWRLLLSTGHGRYAEEMERALYSAISVSVAEDGRHFFYANPLHVREGHDGSNADSPSERLPWYACACCPPNLARLFASLPHYLATRDDDGLQIHLLTAATVQADGVTVTLDTRYPWDGRV